MTEISEVAIKYTLAVDCLGLPASGALDPHLDPQMLAAGTLALLVQKCKYSLVALALPLFFFLFFFRTSSLLSGPPRPTQPLARTSQPRYALCLLY